MSRRARTWPRWSIRFFRSRTKPETRPLKYNHGDNSLEIIPSVLGLPTVFDKDVLIYCISKLIDMQNNGQSIGPCIRLTTHDLLVQTNRPTNNLGYERLAPALDRLKGVTIKTNIKTGDSITTRGFGLISEYEYNRKGSMFADRLRYLEIELSPWLFRAIEACEVLPISRGYFRLRGRLTAGFTSLRASIADSRASGACRSRCCRRNRGRIRRRRNSRFICAISTASNHLPDYTMTIEGEQVVFWRREQGSNGRKPAPAPRSF